MSSRKAFVEVRRGGLVESRHCISAALVDEQGQLLAWTGDPELLTYARSSAKPFQALPLVADGVAEAFGFTDVELAICCASHSGEPAHVETVRSLLNRIGCAEDDLECGPHAPLHAPSSEALRKDHRDPSRIHNNCSGKHTGMMAWACHHGVAKEGYRLADHPVQQRIRREIADWTDSPAEALHPAIDGCGVVTYALPLNRMAGAFAKLVAAAERDPVCPAARVSGAMTGEPYFVAGTDRLSTQLMEITSGRVLAKSGAEGLFCLGERERRWGLALKVEDGRKRAVGPGVVEFLAQVGLLSGHELHSLDAHRTGSLANTRDEIVGELRADFRVERTDQW